MEEHKIVPNILDEEPKEKLQLKYPSGVTVNMGNELTPTQVNGEPIVSWNADENAYYTLAMFDPDAPPQIREVRHWLVGNIPGNSVENGDVLVAFVGSGPMKDTGLHRYIFLVYKQSGKLNFDEPRCDDVTREYRVGTSMKDFVAKYNLGNPVAGNFYRAEYDDYVPLLHARWVKKV